MIKLRSVTVWAAWLSFFLIFSATTWAADQTVQNLEHDVCELETAKTFSLTEMPEDFEFKTVAVNKIGRVFIGAGADWNTGIIFFTATAASGPTSWTKAGPLLDGKVATVRLISPNPDKDGEAIADVQTYATEDMQYLFYTYNNGITWNQAKSPDAGLRPGFRKTWFVKFDASTSAVIFSIDTSKNKLYKWSGTPPLMTMTEYASITGMGAIHELVSFGDGNVFAIGKKTGGQNAIFRAKTSDFKTWEETTIPAGGTAVKYIARAPDGGFLAFIQTTYIDANVWRSSDGKTWTNLLKNIVFSSGDVSTVSHVAYAKSGVMAIYSSGKKVYRLKSTQGNAALSNMFGEVPFTGYEWYNLDKLTGSPNGYFVSVNDHALRTVKCNSQPLMYPPTRTGRKNQLVTLTTQEANDIEKDTLQFSWTQTEGQPVTLSSTTSSAPTFTPTQVGTIKFNLSITDTGYPPVAPLVVPYTVNVIQNDPPVVSTEADKSCALNQNCSMTSTGSDPDGDPVLYQWTQLSGSPVTLVNHLTATASFTPTVEGTYSFKVEVGDSINAVANADTITITVGSPAPPAEPGVFSVNAGNDQTCTANQSCTLTGTVNPGELPVARVQWLKLSGPTLFIENGHQETIVFTPVTAGTYVMKFSAQDSHNSSVTDTLTLTVTAEEVAPQPLDSNPAIPATTPDAQVPSTDCTATNSCPPAQAIPDETNDASNQVDPNTNADNEAPLLQVPQTTFGQTMEPITIDPLTIDPEQSAVTIEWSQKSGPATKYGTDNEGSLFFVPTEPGTYLFEAKAKDAQGKYSETKTVKVVINGETNNDEAPLAPGVGLEWLLIGVVGIGLVLVVVVGSLSGTKKGKK